MTGETFTWIDPVGASTVLSVGWNSQVGDMTGRYMPAVQHQEDVIPLQPGARHRLTLHMEHDFILPINVRSTSLAGLRTALRALMYAMNPTRGSGIVRVSTVLGDLREIECYYVTGLEVAENADKSGRYGQQCYVTFRAYDPYWRDISDTAATWQVTATPNFFPFFPLRLTSSAIVVHATVSNGGDVPTWPVWTIIGPGSGIVLQNGTTGEEITFLTTVLGVGQTISIDTRPGNKTVTRNDGTNLFSDLDPLSTLWQLQQGANVVNLQMAGTAPNVSVLNLNYRQKYLSP